MAVMPPGRSFRTGRLARAGFVAGLLTAGATVWWTGFFRTDPAKEWNGIEAAAAAGRWELAARHLTTWLDRHPDDRRARLLLGGVLWRIQRDDAARSVLSKIQQGDAEWARSQELLAEIALRRHDAPEAERALRAVIHAEPRSTTARRRLIYLLVLEQRNEEARATLEELYALTHDVRDLITMVSLAAVEPDARDVRPELELFLAQTPNDPWLRRARGLVLLQLGQPHEAQVDLDFAARSIDDDPIGRLALGESRLLLGQTDRLPELLGPTPKRPDLAARWHALLARASESRGEDDQAIAGARRAVEIDPRLRDAHYRLGQLLLRRGPDQAAEAKRHLDRAEALRTAEALFKAELNEAIAGRRDTPRFERLARLSFDAGLGASGRAWLEQALTGDPTQSALQAELARLGATSPAPVNPSPVIPRLRSTPREETIQVRAVSEPSSGSSPSTPRFENIAERSGLHFQYDAAPTGNLFIGDTMGGGVGLIDFDRDGWLDVYLVNGCRLPLDLGAEIPSPNRLFRNKRDGTFQDVTATARVGGRGYGMGCAVGDYDGDGHDDLFVTGLGQTVLYRNEGNGTFRDVTERAGVLSTRWTTAAGFADLDGDGDLDLVSVTYVDADPSRVPDCRDQLGKPIHCPPGRFAAQPDLLFRNNGDGTFTDVSHEAGIDVEGGDGLGLAIADLDDDGRLDLFVANDAAPNFLFRNLGGLRFEEVGVVSGVAYDGTGRATASMGVVAEDLDADGRIDLFHTNFNNEPNTFLRNLGGGQFADATAALGLEAPSRPHTGFGTVALDADSDGALDLFVANGHVDEQPWFNIPMAQRPQLYRGRLGRAFVEERSGLGPYFEGRVVGRGAASGDLDQDGRVDLVVVHRDRPTALLRNTTDPAGHWVSVELAGTRAAPMPVGARVVCHVAGRSQTRWLTSGTSYLSQSDRRLAFGLGRAERVDRLEVRWPSGKHQVWSNLAADRFYTITEADGPAPPRSRAASAR